MTAKILFGILANLCSLKVQLFISDENHFRLMLSQNQSDRGYSGNGNSTSRLNRTNPSDHAAAFWPARSIFLARSRSRPQPAAFPDQFQETGSRRSAPFRSGANVPRGALILAPNSCPD